ncbi:DUF1272 domain-containing protein [Streptomyces sp. NPDC002928]|uniref:DUF1272 domain-containing protein n=1 Tax=Streptomyces sp. NPDC002928 TaxID=3154440 RepID=UPI0033A1E19C
MVSTVRTVLGDVPPDAQASICSYECTFCVPCGKPRRNVCPNRGGELVPKPRRAVQPPVPVSP